MASSAVEEYLQAIYTLADENGHVVSARLAEFLGFSAPAVSEMVHRLERDGLISLDGHKEVHLTRSGKTQADSVVRRHRLAERFLVEVLGFEWWKTHEEAERPEHAMSRRWRCASRASSAIRRRPHGNPVDARRGRDADPAARCTLPARRARRRSNASPISLSTSRGSRVPRLAGCEARCGLSRSSSAALRLESFRGWRGLIATTSIGGQEGVMAV